MPKVKLNLILFLIVALTVAFADEKENLCFFFKARENLSQSVADKTGSAATFNNLNELALLSQALLSFYQFFISSQDVPSCPFEPTCSEYARQAIAKYGFACGLLMALDRFQRCNGLGHSSYPHLKNKRLLDPPEWNLP